MDRLFGDEIQLRSAFPLTFKAFPALAEKFAAFERLCQELGKADAGEKQRLFPVFLKTEGLDARIYQLAQYEYLMAEVSKRAFEINNKALFCNPTLETTALHFDYPDIHLQQGLFAIFKNESDSVCVLKLNKVQAQIIDLLREDFSWNFESLNEVVKNPTELQRMVESQIIHSKKERV